MQVREQAGLGLRNKDARHPQLAGVLVYPESLGQVRQEARWTGVCRATCGLSPPAGQRSEARVRFHTVINGRGIWRLSPSVRMTHRRGRGSRARLFVPLPLCSPRFCSACLPQDRKARFDAHGRAVKDGVKKLQKAKQANRSMPRRNTPGEGRCVTRFMRLAGNRKEVEAVGAHAEAKGCGQA